MFQSDDVQVSENSVGTNQVGIFIGGNKGHVLDNTVFNSLVLLGIVLNGNDNDAVRNDVTHSDQAGILIQGNDNLVKANRITDAAIGILKVTGSSGTTLAMNRFFATLIPIEDPSPNRAIGVVPTR